MSDIGNGGFSCCPSIVIPQANVVIASNVLSTTGNVLCANIISGDGTFTGNLYVAGQILGTIVYNSLNVFALANIGVVQAGSIFGNGFGISNLNSSNLSGIIPPSLIYGNTLSNIQAANISGLVAVTGNTLSNLNASNIAFGIVSSALIYGNTISNLNSANITQPFANLVVSNTVTTNNTNVQSTLQVTGAMTSNIANTTFYYDTFTIPYINTQVLNVGAITSLTTANVTTLNVQSLFANTLNVVGTSNLSAVISSGQVVATGRTGVGVCPPIVYRQGGSATTWNTPGSNTTPNVYAITSGAVQMQCGANIMTATTQFIPFPVAYTNNPTVLVTSYGTTGNIWVASITSTAFSVTANSAIQFEWLSIGI